MKTKEQIKSEIEYFETMLLENQTKHSQLGQIDMLSGEGSNLRKRIAKTEGKIEALKWVLS
jgi:hypothetical protein